MRRVSRVFVWIFIFLATAGMKCMGPDAIRTYEVKACFDWSKLPDNNTVEVAAYDLIGIREYPSKVTFVKTDKCADFKILRDNGLSQYQCYQAQLSWVEGTKDRLLVTPFLIGMKSDSELAIVAYKSGQLAEGEKLQEDFLVFEKYVLPNLIDPKCVSSKSGWQQYESKSGNK